MGCPALNRNIGWRRERTRSAHLQDERRELTIRRRGQRQLPANIRIREDVGHKFRNFLERTVIEHRLSNRSIRPGEKAAEAIHPCISLSRRGFLSRRIRWQVRPAPRRTK